MPIHYEPCRVRRILNKREQADHWFWDRYSAAPYVRCEYACHTCYSRARTCCPFDDPTDFGRIVRVKVNAAERLRAKLSRVPRDVVSTGDYQPLEKDTVPHWWEIG